MAFITNDQLYTQSFTPREYQVELLYAAKARNIIICLDKLMEKIFISTKLIQETVISNRKPISKGGKRVIYLLKNKDLCTDKATHFKYLTDLRVLKCCSTEDFDLTSFCDKAEILISTIDVCYLLLKDKILDPDHINLLVIDHCHELVTCDKVKFILNMIRKNSSIRIVGFAVPLFSLAEEPGHLSFELERIETFYQCQVETVNDVFFILHYNRGLKEHWIEYQIIENGDFEQNLRECVMHTVEFLKDHRFDPLEIYTEMYYEEIKKIPDPIKKPCEMIDHFLNILSDLGVWCADRAALIYLIQIEKFKVKTPYERHYLLLCIVSTLFLKVRALCNDAFQDLKEEERIRQFSKPKIHRLLETLKNFSPPPQDKTKASKPEDKTAYPSQRRFNNCRSHRNSVRPPRAMYRNLTNPDLLCGIIFVENELLAKVLFYLLNELSKSELNSDFGFLSPLYLSEKSVDDLYSKDVEAEHKKQEEVLKKFRIHECNLLLATSILEQGIELPKCNLVIRFDFPQNYQSYVQCKSRAKSPDALYVMLIPETGSKYYLRRLAHYHYVEKLILSKCFEKQPLELQEKEADVYASLMPCYCPLGGADAPKVSFNSAIALVNKYCAKLPSDTFTRLTPECKLTITGTNEIFCTLRLPINSPLKYLVSSYPMPSVPLAKRTAALKLCVSLHRENELDDYLMPIGKENFVANPEDMELLSFPEDEISALAEARPGTTKRRQYYYKKLAESLSRCRPESTKPCYLYHVNQTLTCPLPEEQNTRGRKIYPPEKSDISFGILTTKKIPKICPFPIYTRSGEVQVDLKLIPQTIILDEEQISKIKVFVNYTFTKVLKLQRYMMLFDPSVSENSYFIVPVSREDTLSSDLVISWNFLDLIYENRNITPETVPEEVRKSFQFESTKYRDAVVMPWYRNQDQPQYFYVAEICRTLNPKSDFPGSDYGTFEDYYLKKYGIQIQNLVQPLLDVDHTSARLNFLTPRYVNRKGVALPTSSEATKRAKRENLEQKQILIAELCSIHPFPSSLWRQAVCLPCILYRINSLLLANQIRVKVAQDIGLGKETPSSDFHWPPLDFGWSLADVLTKGRKLKDEMENIQVRMGTVMNGEKLEKVKEELEKEYSDELEIGTWSNEMVDNHQRYASPTYDSEDYSIDNDSEDSEDDSVDDEEKGGLIIAYMGENQAEAFDNSSKLQTFIEFEDRYATIWELKRSEGDDVDFQKHNAMHINAINDYEKAIMDSDLFIQSNRDVVIRRNKAKPLKSDNDDQENRKYMDHVVKVAEQFQEELINKPIVTKSRSLLSDTGCHYARSSPFTNSKLFSFDYQPDLNDHPGPSPSLLLQALTMSNANDGINLERLETIGDSFLKYAITTYLYSTYDNIHEGKLSHLRSKQVSNLNLYRLGKRKMLGESMIATKFEPHDNWLPPCYYVPKELEQALIASGVPSSLWNEVTTMDTGDFREIDDLVRETENKLNIIRRELGEYEKQSATLDFIPYNLITQHSIPDKSIADCVEALIGAYLIACGPKGALLFMTWLGINVVPKNKSELSLPRSPLLRCVSDNPDEELIIMLDGYEELENLIGYAFRDRSYLLQAFTHASYQPNRLTDCYQRLEFLGDAVLDYLITRHLYEDQRQHSPGALTDLRSALVNNTIFASLAVRCGFHKYFRHLSPGLHSVINRFVRIQEENGHQISEEYCFVGEQEDGCEEAEDVEVPKALGDVFESLAGAIFLDSDMSLDAVWAVYYKIMHAEIEQFSSNVPKSPIRELLELEPETAKFSRPEKLADGRRVRVTVDVFGKGSFKGIGRNYRIAKCTAAKCALKKLKKKTCV